MLQERPPGTTTWKAYGGKKVQILFHRSFGKGCTAHEDGTWVPVFPEPDGRHFVGSGAEDYVDVRCRPPGRRAVTQGG
ncbi:hypothetical protein ACIG0D_17470 [Streptomyces sp. NPDC052773]|uniref:hypothetical protein n=1 Tax=Streptomyces sp. NPDC052773 TaxID=3365693 RepID=UPI0037D2A5BF